MTPTLWLDDNFGCHIAHLGKFPVPQSVKMWKMTWYTNKPS